MYRSKEIFSIIELTHDTKHHSVTHYGVNGEITQPTQIKDHPSVRGMRICKYGEFLVLNEWDTPTRIISKDTLEEEYESITN